jgi:peptidylprolyl isomerase domain and WD repeat-containing protein 1
LFSQEIAINVADANEFIIFSGKVYCVIDESHDNYIALQTTKQPMPSSEFNRKLALEKELAKSDLAKYGNAEFDQTGNFLLYPSMIGKF